MKRYRLLNKQENGALNAEVVLKANQLYLSLYLHNFNLLYYIILIH